MGNPRKSLYRLLEQLHTYVRRLVSKHALGHAKLGAGFVAMTDDGRF